MGVGYRGTQCLPQIFLQQASHSRAVVSELSVVLERLVITSAGRFAVRQVCLEFEQARFDTALVGFPDGVLQPQHQQQCQGHGRTVVGKYGGGQHSHREQFDQQGEFFVTVVLGLEDGPLGGKGRLGHGELSVQVLAGRRLAGVSWLSQRVV